MQLCILLELGHRHDCTTFVTGLSVCMQRTHVRRDCVSPPARPDYGSHWQPVPTARMPGHCQLVAVSSMLPVGAMGLISPMPVVGAFNGASVTGPARCGALNVLEWVRPLWPTYHWHTGTPAPMYGLPVQKCHVIGAIALGPETPPPPDLVISQTMEGRAT